MKNSHRVSKVLLSLLLCVAMILPAGCKAEPDSGKQEPAQHIDLDVWTKETSINVMQDVIYDDTFKNKAEIRVSGGRGEYEGVQLIITASSDKDISQYSLELSDLTNDTNRIDKSYIDIYNERYIEVVSTPSNVSTGLGWYADALVPFEKAVEYGENKVEAGKNQGIYVDIFIPRTAVPGEYTGTFTLTLDGENFDIPVSLTVWDFEVSQESHLETDWIAGFGFFAEADSTPELSDSYFEAIAAHRASAHSMSSGALSADEWLERVRIYTNPNLRDENGNPLVGEKQAYLAQINIPAEYNATTGISHVMFDTYVSRLLKASIEDGYNYLAKMGAYLGFIDEPQYNNTWDKVKFVCEKWQERKAYWAEVIATANIEEINLKSGGELAVGCLEKLPADFVSELEESMRLLGCYVTIHPDSRLDSSATVQFCSQVTNFFSERQLLEYANWTDVPNSGNWWYAVSSTYGDSIDSQPMEQRLSGWFTYDKDLQGYLVWSTNLYYESRWDTIANSSVYAPCDPYALALRISNGAGCGFIFYPGKAYGIRGPLSSIRSLQYREGSEDYEYFYLLNELYEKEGYSPDAVLGKIFNSMYSQYYINADAKFFTFQREQIVNLILLAQKGVFVTDFTELDAVANMQVISKGEERIASVNGVAQDLHTQASVTANMEQSDKLSFVTSSGLEFTLALGGKATKLFDPDTDVVVRGGTVEKVELDGEDAAMFTFVVDASIPEDERSYDFTYAADKTQVNADAQYLTATLYSSSKEPVVVECWLMGKDDRTVYIGDVVLYEGYNTLYTHDLEHIKWGNIRQVSGVRFKVDVPEGADSATVYCTSVNIVN